MLGITLVSLSEDWVVASCADGRVYVWDRKTTNTMAVLASQVRP
jgi:WD40 repeat protein